VTTMAKRDSKGRFVKRKKAGRKTRRRKRR
jgi:hypothetical protein